MSPRVARHMLFGGNDRHNHRNRDGLSDHLMKDIGLVPGQIHVYTTRASTRTSHIHRGLGVSIATLIAGIFK